MQYETLDYRNGKYQGPTNPNGQRHGLGIFIDDDLTFYLSHWHHNKLNGPSLLYISHGKYIYGEWSNNQLSGLAVFRFADTVIIGNFQNNFPHHKCLIIFQRFNFACLFEQNQSNWHIVESGTLTSHKMLLSFIDKIGVAVPDHYFSLSKFLSDFTLNSNHLKSFPCSIGCSYFGFLNGLGMVFNSNNGLVSIGQHTVDKLSQFGGRFDSSKSGCEGNFQPCGERIPYVGQRPIHQIYPIYNRLHKRSLNFVNQYFDSTIKFFTDVQNFLKNQIKIISEQCKSTRFNIGDLNESLDYQQYTEEQSLKINSIRDILYSPTNNSFKEQIIQLTNTESAKKQATAKSIPESQKEQIFADKFFKKSTVKEPPTTERNKQNQTYQQQTPHLKYENNYIEPVEVFPSRKPKNLPQKQEIRQPYKILITPTVQANLVQLSPQNNCKTNGSEQAKTKQKMRSNNLRYIQNQIGHKEERSKGHSQTKKNNVYLETYKAQNQQSPENYKVPTFRGLIQEVESIKQSKRQTKIHKYQSPEKPKQPIKHQFINKSNIKKQKNVIYQPSNAGYEDIEQRRKRILKEFKNINQQAKKNVFSPRNAGMLLKYDTPTQGFAFSLQRQDEQGSFGVVPLSITRTKADSPPKTHNFKKNQTYLTPSKQQPQEPKPQKSQKPNNISYKTYLNEYPDMKNGQTDKNANHYQPKKPNDHSKRYEEIKKQNLNEVIQPSTKTTNYNQNESPSRLKLRKSYQYLYE